MVWKCETAEQHILSSTLLPGQQYAGSWHGAKVLRCHKPTKGRAHWTYDVELVERSAQARQRPQVAEHIPADALRPRYPVQPFSDFCRLEPGLVVEHMCGCLCASVVLVSSPVDSPIPVLQAPVIPASGQPRRTTRSRGDNVAIILNISNECDDCL